jgi:hypothetical protein
MTDRATVVTLLVVAALAVATLRWVGEWRALPAAVGADGPARNAARLAKKVIFGRSDGETIALATAAGIVLAAPLAAHLVTAAAWFAGVTGLDAAAWAPAGADAIVIALVAAAVLDVGVIGMWRGAVPPLLARLAVLRPALRHSIIGLLLPAVLVAGVPLLAQTTADAVTAVAKVPPPPACAPPNLQTTVAGYGPAQLANAAVIVQVGRDMGIPARGWWIALATAMQESTLKNLDYGDRDSLGLFQQRPSQGWGTPAQVRDPVYASTRFYERLRRVRGWEGLPLWQAAQAVQRSAFPTYYSRHEKTAAAVLGAVTNTPCRSTA